MLRNDRDLQKGVRELGDEGFSLLELVVAVGILLVLTVGGLLAYNGITENARQSSLNQAASEIYTLAKFYETDDKPETEPWHALKEWTDSSGYEYSIITEDPNSDMYMALLSNSPIDLNNLNTVQLQAVIYNDSSAIAGLDLDASPQGEGIFVYLRDLSKANLEGEGEGALIAQRG